MPSLKEEDRYSEVLDRKSEGATYTPTELADFVAEQMINQLERIDLTSPLRVLDPAVGDGELLISLLKKLTTKHDAIEVHGFDTNKTVLQLAQERISKLFPLAKIKFEHADFLEKVLSRQDNTGQQNMFASESDFELFDLIIANPPYVRTQVMGAKKSQELARQFKLTGRVDLYYAFILGIGKVLSPKGIAGVIVSNRFMTTKSGKVIREKIQDHFTIKHVWDFGDTKLFDAAVLPAVLLLNGTDDKLQAISPKLSSIYESYSVEVDKLVPSIFEAITTNGVVEIADGRKFTVKHGILTNDGDASGVWRIANDETDSWLDSVKSHTWKRFGDIGKIRVGVKTTADKVFIRSDWDQIDPKPELLYPLITHHCAQRYKAQMPKKPKQILYPHTVVNGKKATVDLSEYPNSKAYLEKHRESLEGRKYLIEAKRKWYEIWVSQDPQLWKYPKIIFRDISEKPTFWVDFDGGIVNGDCYWLTLFDTKETDLLWLALAIGNSTFIEDFYDRMFNNKLYAGRRRFITQYVEQFPLPTPESEISKLIIILTKKIYSISPSPETTRLEEELNKMIYSAFGLTV